MLQLPPNFAKDIEGKNTNLYPVVIFETSNTAEDDLMISINEVTLGLRRFKPLLLNMPSLKESIDIEKRNYKISSVSLNISNFPYEGKRFSELIEGSFINTKVKIYWVSQSYDISHTIGFDDDGDEYAFQLYYGTVRRYEHDNDKVKITIEDKSQATLHKDLPLSKNYLTEENGYENVPDKYLNKPIPMVYGRVDKSPCVIKSSPVLNEWGLDAGNVDILADTNNSDSNLAGVSPLFAYIDEQWLNIPKNIGADLIELNTYDVFDYSPNTIQYIVSNNSLQLQSFIDETNDENKFSFQ